MSIKKTPLGSMINNGKLFDHTKYNITKQEENPKFWADLFYTKVTSVGPYGEKNFGLLGHVAETTKEVIIYNHPAFKKIAQTAFTDGHYIFMDADFLMDMVKDQALTGSEDGVFVILHECGHMLFEHCEYFKDYMKVYPKTTNKALDMALNIGIYKDFVETGLIKGPGKKVSRGVGFHGTLMNKEDDIAATLKSPIENMKDAIEKYGRLDEIQILDDFLLRTNELPQDENVNTAEKNLSPKDIEDACKRAGLDKVWDKIKDDIQNKDTNEPLPQEENKNNDPSQQGDQPQQGQGNDPSQQGGQPQQGQGNDPSQQGTDYGQNDPNSKPSKSIDDLMNSLAKNGQMRHAEKILKELGYDLKVENGKIQENESDKHFINQGDLAKILEDNGLEHIKKTLNIPDSDDKKALKEKSQERKATFEACIETHTQETMDVEKKGGKGRGGSTAMQARKRIELQNKSDLRFKTVMSDMILGNGGENLTINDNTLNSIFYLDGGELGLTSGSRIVEPGNILAQEHGVVLVLVDTSGSVSRDQLIKFMSQIKSIVNSEEEDSCNTVILYNMDSQISQDFEIINDTNIEEWLDNATAYEGGGTCIQTGIIQALNEFYDNEAIKYHPKIQNRKLTNLIVFSDGEDNVPNADAIMQEVFSFREDDNLPFPATVFAFDKKSFISQGENFARGAPWAITVPIDDKIGVVDLEIVKEKQAERMMSNYGEYESSRGFSL